nr:hypothetical protein [uncultured bacterium]
MESIWLITTNSRQEVRKSCCVLKSTILLAKEPLIYGDFESCAVLKLLIFCFSINGTELSLK